MVDVFDNLDNQLTENDIFDKMKDSPLDNAMREFREAIGPVQLVSKKRGGGGGSREIKNSKEKNKLEKTHTNPKSGLTFNLYDQAQGPWASKLAKTGCMNTAAACVSSAIDKSITPIDFWKKARHSFVYDSVPKITNKRLISKVLLDREDKTWEPEQLEKAKKEIINHLRGGNPSIFMVHGTNKKGGQNPYVPGQHYFCAIDIRGEPGKEEIFVANTHGGQGGGWFPTDIFTSMKQASLYTPA